MWERRPGLDGNHDITTLDDHHDGDDLDSDDKHHVRIGGNHDLGCSRDGFEYIGDHRGPAGRSP